MPKRKFCEGPHTWRAIRRGRENWWVCAQRKCGAELRNEPPLLGVGWTQAALDERWATMESWLDVATMIEEGEKNGRENHADD